MKTWDNSLDNYLQMIQELIDELKNEEVEISGDRLRLIKEAIINFPEGILEVESKDLEEKYIPVNLMNLLSTALKRRT